MISKRVYMESPTELNIFLTSSTFFLIRDACLMDSFSKGSKLFLSSKIAILPKQTFPPLSRSNIHYTFSHFRWCSKHLSFGIQGLTSVFFRRTAETVRRKGANRWVVGGQGSDCGYSGGRRINPKCISQCLSFHCWWMNHEILLNSKIPFYIRCRNRFLLPSVSCFCIESRWRLSSSRRLRRSCHGQSSECKWFQLRKEPWRWR